MRNASHAKEFRGAELGAWYVQFLRCLTIKPERCPSSSLAEEALEAGRDAAALAPCMSSDMAGAILRYTEQAGLAFNLMHVFID